MVSEIKSDKLLNQSGDQDSGIDLSTNDVVKINIAGSEKARIHSDGTVGLGTSSPNSYDSRANNLVVGDSGDAGVTIFSGATSNARLQFAPSGSTGLDNGLIDYDNNNDVMSFATGGSERARFTDAGHFLIGTTSNSDNSESGYRFIKGASGYSEFVRTSTSDSSANIYVARGNDGRVLAFYRNESTAAQVGNITVGSSSTAYNTSSDYRLKESVNYSWDATTRLKQLKPARFNFKVDKDTTVDGFLAHEVSSIVPEAVTGTKDEVKVWKKEDELPEGVSVGDNKLDDDGNTIPVMQGIDQSKLVPLLVKTIQELEARIAVLEAK